MITLTEKEFTDIYIALGYECGMSASSAPREEYYSRLQIYCSIKELYEKYEVNTLDILAKMTEKLSQSH